MNCELGVSQRLSFSRGNDAASKEKITCHHKQSRRPVCCSRGASPAASSLPSPNDPLRRRRLHRGFNASLEQDCFLFLTVDVIHNYSLCISSSVYNYNFSSSKAKHFSQRILSTLHNYLPNLNLSKLKIVQE